MSKQLCYCGGRRKNPVLHIFAEAFVSIAAPAGNRIDLTLTEEEQPKLVLCTSYEIARLFASMASLYVAALRCTHDCPRGGALSPQRPEDEVQIFPAPGPPAEQQPREGDAAAALVRMLEPPRARSRAANEGLQSVPASGHVWKLQLQFHATVYLRRVSVELERLRESSKSMMQP